MTQTHKHRCDKCHTIWEHANSMAGDVQAHKCPKCGEEQWYKYLGHLAVTFIQSCRNIVQSFLYH